MTGKERVIAAIHHKETDRIPHYVELGSEEAEKMRVYSGNPGYEESLENDIDMIGLDGFLRPLAEKSGYYSDDFGVLWNRNGADKDIGVIESRLLSQPEDLCKYVFPAIREKEIRQKVEGLLGKNTGNFKVMGYSFTMFERAWTLRGMEDLLVDMIEEPEFVHELLRKICDYNCAVLAVILEYDVDGICLGDDWGQQKGMIMGPALWRAFIKPQMARMYQQIKGSGKYVIQHSCGDVSAVFEDLIEIGLDVYQTFQPEIYPMEQVKKEIGERLTFWGGISTQRLLPFATPEEVERKIIETARIMRGGGGYILAPTHTVPKDVPPENIEMMAEVFRHQNQYFRSE